MYGSPCIVDRLKMNDVRRVADSIRKIVKELRISSKNAERVTGLSGAQLFVLQRLSAKSPLSVNELAELTFTHQSSVSVVVQRLVQKKLVVRARSVRDGRSVELGLTPKGRALCGRAPEAAQQRMFSAITKLRTGDRRKLAGLLEVVVGYMGLDSGPAELFFEEAKPRKRSNADVGP